MKILLLDDDPMVVQSCRRILEEEGVDIRTASSVACASVILTEETFDLMITDINMPERNGFAIIAEAKATRPEMPILAMTGYLTAETAEKMPPSRYEPPPRQTVYADRTFGGHWQCPERPTDAVHPFVNTRRSGKCLKPC